MKDIEDRKRALLAESEVYRQTLKLEFYNLRLFIKQSKVNAKSFVSPNSWWLMGALAPFLARRPVFSKWRLVGAVVAGWKLYNRFGPLITRLWSSFGRTRRARRHTEEEIISSRM